MTNREYALLAGKTLSAKKAQDIVLVKSVEGKQNSGWILMDFGDIIVNLFTKEMREKYSIEKIWGDCDFIEVEE